LYSRWDFKKYLGLVDVLQPDISHAGGISEVRKICAMAKAFDTAIALHCPLGPLTFAASLQVDACAPNAFIQEQSLGIHYNTGTEMTDYVRNSEILAYHDGYVTIPDAPGLGLEINEDAVREASKRGHNWKNPLWPHADGSIAEW
jgi:galactonate dehydratase